jgi:hypothetical protein
MKATAGLAVLAGSLASVAIAHPHFNKTVTAALGPDLEVTISYNTTPANETHAANAKAGDFLTPRRPVLKLSGEVKTEKASLPAGEYTIGVVKNGDKDWSLALYPGRLQRGDTPDPAKAIRLDSMFSTDKGTAQHMLIDVTPGDGRFEGKAVLTLHFGSLFVAGLLA